jgi:nitrogen fixation protein FixH
MTREWTGRHILLALLGTFAVVLGVNGYFIVMAERTYPGEDVHHPYLQGIEYNQTLKDRARQAELGWKATIGGTLDADGTATITVTLADKTGAPVSSEALKGLLRHPMDEELDHTIALHAEGNGTYVGRVAHVRAGRWDVVVTRKTDKEAPFEAVRRIWLR